MASQRKKIKTAENVFTIIEKIATLDQPDCSELVEHVDLSVSTVYNYVNTLENAGYVIKTGGRYRLSLKFLKLGRTVRNSYPIMHAAAEPVDILSKMIDEYISVFVKEGPKVVMAHEANSSHAVKVPAPFLGEPFHLGRSPQGKVVLAHMPDDEQREIIDRMGIDSGEAEQLRAELDSIEEGRLSIDEGQAHENIWAVAAPVKADGRVHGSITISTVQHRLDERRANDELPKLLEQTVNEIEHRLSVYDFTDIYSTW